MAPDKIYVSEQTVSTGKVYGLWYTTKQEETEAYLRKDALLECAKEELGSTSILRSETIETLQKVIDKLNSL